MATDTVLPPVHPGEILLEDEDLATLSSTRTSTTGPRAGSCAWPASAARRRPGRERDQAVAQAWHERNLAALASAGPLWAVLGDSLSQGVGASSIEHSWVLQTRRAPHRAG